jgi:serine/threonine protein kinase/tetratricopeptide (TPR) repeat protein
MVDANPQSLLASPDGTAVSPPAPLPERIGKYEVVALLGSGAMGVVYKCRQPDLERFVAVKVLGAISAADVDLRQRFLREARVAAQLHHPNTVRIYDVGVDGAHPYLVLEWIDGRPLDQLIRDPVLTVDGSLRVAFHVAQALHDAHEHGVVHRDVKPSNILIDQAGRPKLADFGLAKFVDGSKSLSGVGDLIGTPKYMSPEQVLLPSEEIDARTDVFSLGAVLYEMLTGKPPFDGPTPLAILRQLTDEDPTPPHEVNPEIPDEVAAICMKALAKDRDKRYLTAEAFADAIQSHVLHRWFGSPEVELLAGLPPLSTSPPVKNRWRWWQWGGLIIAGIVTGIMLAQWWPPANHTTTPTSVLNPEGEIVVPVIDLEKLAAKGAEEYAALPGIVDSGAHRQRLQATLEDLAAAAKQRRDEPTIAVLRSRLLRRAGDFNGAIEALSGVTENSPAVAAERMLARYQWQALLLGNLEDPLLRPKAPDSLIAEAKIVEKIDPMWAYAAKLAEALSKGDVPAAREIADTKQPATTDRNLLSDVAMLRADTYFRAAELEYLAETSAEKKPERDRARERREKIADLAAQTLRRSVEADQNHYGLRFLMANSYHRRAIWGYGEGDSRSDLLRRQRPAFDTALAQLRMTTPLRGADHAVARMVLNANFGRHDAAQDQLADAMSLRPGEPLTVYAAWLKLLNPTDGQLSVADAESILKDLAKVFETPPSDAPPYYVRALANAAAGRWEDARGDVRQLVKFTGPNLVPSIAWQVRLWISHANGSTTKFQHAIVDVLWQLPTPVDLRINIANEVIKRASDPEICKQEGIIPRDAAAIRAFVHWRLAKFSAEKSDRDGVYRHAMAALREKADDMHAGKFRDDEMLRVYNSDPDFIELYLKYPPQSG